MSESKAKERRKELALMSDETNPREVADEMAVTIRKMIEDRDAKVTSAKEHLVSQLEVTSDKYRTANGVMSALDTLRTVYGDDMDDDIFGQISEAKLIATAMSARATSLAARATELTPEAMDLLCEGVYDEFFSDSFEANEDLPFDMAVELMVLQLCQNVGQAAQDIVDFAKHADEEIDKARDTLREHCESNGLDFLEVCGEKPEG